MDSIKMIRVKFIQFEKIYFLLLIFTFLTFSTFGVVKGQLVDSNHQNSKTYDGKILMGKLFISGFPSWMPIDLLPVMQSALNLTDKQIKAIEDLADLFNSFTRLEEHARNPYQKNPLREKCEDGATQLEKTLGEDKFAEFCQWAGEETTIRTRINNLMSKNRNLNADEISKKVFDEIEKNYRTFNEKK